MQIDPLFIFTLILLLLIPAILFIGLPLWTYLDAQKHSSNSPPLWALLVFLVPLIGLILYFLLGRDKLQSN